MANDCHICGDEGCENCICSLCESMKPCGPKEGYGWLSPIYGREECPPEGVEWCSFCGAYTSCDEYDNLQPACDCSNYKGGYQVTSKLNWNKIGDFLEAFPSHFYEEPFHWKKPGRVFKVGQWRALHAGVHAHMVPN